MQEMYKDLSECGAVFTTAGYGNSAYIADQELLIKHNLMLYELQDVRASARASRRACRLAMVYAIFVSLVAAILAAHLLVQARG